MVQIHSPRPSPVEPILYRHANRRRPPGVGRTRRSSVQIEALRLRYFPFSHRLTLRLRDVRNRRKLSDLSNACLLREVLLVAQAEIYAEKDGQE